MLTAGGSLYVKLGNIIIPNKLTDGMACEHTVAYPFSFDPDRGIFTVGLTAVKDGLPALPPTVCNHLTHILYSPSSSQRGADMSAFYYPEAGEVDVTVPPVTVSTETISDLRGHANNYFNGVPLQAIVSAALTATLTVAGEAGPEGIESCAIPSLPLAFQPAA